MKVGPKRFTPAKFESKKKELSSSIRLKLALLSILWGLILLGLGIGIGFLADDAIYSRYANYERLNAYLTFGYMAVVLVGHILQDIYLGKSAVFQYFGFFIALAIFHHAGGFLVGPITSMNLIYNMLCWRTILREAR
jgi:hypothetical protein